MLSHCRICGGTGKILKRHGYRGRCPLCFQDPCPDCGVELPYMCRSTCKLQTIKMYSAPGSTKCVCGRPADWHRWDESFVGYDGPFLKLLCNGDKVKI